MKLAMKKHYKIFKNALPLNDELLAYIKSWGTLTKSPWKCYRMFRLNAWKSDCFLKIWKEQLFDQLRIKTSIKNIILEELFPVKMKNDLKYRSRLFCRHFSQLLLKFSEHQFWETCIAEYFCNLPIPICFFVLCGHLARLVAKMPWTQFPIFCFHSSKTTSWM